MSKKLSKHQFLPARSKVVVRVEVSKPGDSEPFIRQVFYATGGEVTVKHDAFENALTVSAPLVVQE